MRVPGWGCRTRAKRQPALLAFRNLLCCHTPGFLCLSSLYCLSAAGQRKEKSMWQRVDDGQSTGTPADETEWGRGRFFGERWSRQVIVGVEKVRTKSQPGSSAGILSLYCLSVAQCCHFQTPSSINKRDDGYGQLRPPVSNMLGHPQTFQTSPSNRSLVKGLLWGSEVCDWVSSLLKSLISSVLSSPAFVSGRFWCRWQPLCSVSEGVGAQTRVINDWERG